MRKILLGSLIASAILFADSSNSTMYQRFEAMEKEMQRLKNELAQLKAQQATKEKAEQSKTGNDALGNEDDDENSTEYSEDDSEKLDVNEAVLDLQDSVSELNKATSGNHLKLNVDFRTSYDSVNYKTADGSRHENNDILSNRLWLNMNWAANRNISFSGQLAYNKTYGERFGNTGSGAGFEQFDWIASENPNADGTVRVKSAYFFYRNDKLFGTDVPWTFSVGRRPSTNGHLINLRDDDPAASPSGHTINVEFDGISAKFTLEKVTGVEGMYLKLCGGQGATDAQEMFSSAPYAQNRSDSTKSIQLAGLIFVPYDDGQYSLGTQFYGATNLIDIDQGTGQFDTYGNIYSYSMYATVHGIGNEISDFLDDTVFFASGAISRTDPDDGKAMLGSSDMQNGYSYWFGLNMPSLISEEGRFGLEFNHGSKYWRSITYAEDTLVGSKVAARGNAYEIYFTEPLIEDIFTFQIRYTYIDYDYAGSNGFFGDGGTPLSIDEAIVAGQGANVVDKAQNLRVYLRYRY